MHIRYASPQDLTTLFLVPAHCGDSYIRWRACVLVFISIKKTMTILVADVASV